MSRYTKYSVDYLRSVNRGRVRYDLTANAYRLLFLLTSTQTPGAPGVALTGSQEAIAEVLGCSQPTVSKCLKQLREAGVIKPLDGGRWQIHADYMLGGYRPSEKVVAMPLAA
ncbi:helix-turn-helix domain-containing protein [Streptomyces sp. NPDC058157]|uniref:helix-turn-helix domain-containing protein n=1 Tax=Streptomyces sp. NPDC058157 TaxID=3346360 RepID=UPI0036EDCF63